MHSAFIGWGRRLYDPFLQPNGVYMKRKLIKKNKQFWKKFIDESEGWPIGIRFYDYYSPQMLVEDKYYRDMNKEARTKKSRVSGFYTEWFGEEPSRYCVGRKGKIIK